jgi:hypothetical protein
LLLLLLPLKELTWLLLLMPGILQIWQQWRLLLLDADVLLLLLHWCPTADCQPVSGASACEQLLQTGAGGFVCAAFAQSASRHQRHYQRHYQRQCRRVQEL